jgi:hypothetical protein
MKPDVFSNDVRGEKLAFAQRVNTHIRQNSKASVESVHFRIIFESAWHIALFG